MSKKPSRLHPDVHEHEMTSSSTATRKGMRVLLIANEWSGNKQGDQLLSWRRGKEEETSQQLGLREGKRRLRKIPFSAGRQGERGFCRKKSPFPARGKKGALPFVERTPSVSVPSAWRAPWKGTANLVKAKKGFPYGRGREKDPPFSIRRKEGRRQRR